jgi:hypothetical protein
MPRPSKSGSRRPHSLLRQHTTWIPKRNDICGSQWRNLLPLYNCLRVLGLISSISNSGPVGRSTLKRTALPLHFQVINSPENSFTVTWHTDISSQTCAKTSY